MQWIAYFKYDRDKTVAVATGATRTEAITTAITRTLCKGVVDGAIGAQQRDDVDAKDFAALTTFLDDWFKDKAAPALVGSGG